MIIAPTASRTRLRWRTNSGRSAFAEAFYEYLQNLPEKKNKRSVLARIDFSDLPTAETIQEAITKIERKHAQKKSVKVMKRVLGPVVAVLKDYYGVIDTLCPYSTSYNVCLVIDIFGCSSI